MNLESLKKSAKFWEYFIEISKVPRPTFHEEKIKKYLIDWANSHNFHNEVDEADNILIKVPATKGFENKESILIQAHKDMVCEKHLHINHDFFNDELKLRIVDGWLKATGTTLGADNGLGIAYAMAIAVDKNLKHSEIEILITASEEKGLVGVAGLRKNWFKSKKVLNLDTEDWKEIYIGCAGSCGQRLEQDISFTDNENNDCLKLKISGLKGGHSGVNINDHRLNAGKVLLYLLNELKDKVDLNFIDSGNLPNAIARDSNAIISFKNKNRLEVLNIVKNFNQKWKVTYKKVEENLNIEAVEVDKNLDILKKVIIHKDFIKLVNIGLIIHHGVKTMSPSINGLVESSSNLASIKQLNEDKKITLFVYSRSDNNLLLENCEKDIKNLANVTGLKCIKTQSSIGWMPNYDSSLLQTTKSVFEENFFKTPKITAIHAGLECGALKAKYPDIDIVSFGPNIRNAHSPDEMLEISSAIECYDFTKLLVEKLSGM